VLKYLSRNNWRLVMKKLLAMTAMSVAVMLLVLPVVYGQDKAAPPSQAQASERVFQGQLSKVDAKTISIKGQTSDMTFDYTDATQVVGADGKVQGLASKTGTQLRVTYREAEGKRTATKIEVVPEKK
jgi:hypothetical protein